MVLVKPFFSIIIPLYNSQEFISDAVESVLNQTYSDWELIIVDDGSQDESLDIARKFEQNYDVIKVFTHPNNKNKCVSASRNLGIENSNGKWIAFLDADDEWKQDKLKKQYDIIKRYDENLVFVYCRSKVFDEHGKVLSSAEMPVYNNKMDFYGNGIHGLSESPFKWVIKKGFEAPTSSVVVRAEIVNKFNLKFKEYLDYSEDGLFWYSVIRHGHIFYLDEPLMYYRVHLKQWNARTQDETKIGRRFLAYNEMLKDYDHDHYIQKLLVTIGFRNLVVHYLLSGLRLGKIGGLLVEVINRKDILTKYKFLSLGIVFVEIFKYPLRWMNQKVKTT